MWRGLGILSPHGAFLEAYDSDGPFVLQRYADSQKGSSLVLVTARLERLTKKQVLEASDLKMGTVNPTR
jgi:hypothetical protein